MELYHLNEDRSEHYRHASAKVKKAMAENEIPLSDRNKTVPKAAKTSSARTQTIRTQNTKVQTSRIQTSGTKKTSGQSYSAQTARTYSTGKKTAKSEKKKSGKAGKIVALLLACALVGGGSGFGAAALMQKNAAAQPQSTTQASSDASVMLEAKRQAAALQVASVDTGKVLTPSEVYAQNVNSTVGITTSITTNYFGYQTTSAAAGSGFILTQDGYILTNYHVVEGSNSIKVTTYDGTSYDAQLIGYDESNDIAVLKIDATGLNAAAFGDSDQIEVGELAVAIGNPMGQVHGSVTAGIISAVEQELTIDDVTINAIQTDAAINPGNSGGALFDSYGNVIGIVYAKSSSVSIEGIGYAIPVNNIKDLVAQMINDPDSVKDQTKGSQIMLGITIRDITEDMSKQYSMPVGVYITEVSSMSAAERAGLQKGDIITEFAGETVTSADDLNAIKAKQTSGDTVSVKIDRNGKEMTLDLVIPQPTEVDTASNK